MLATKVNAIVAGQTSVEAPEKAASEAHLPIDVYPISCHSLHEPTVTPSNNVSYYAPLCVRPRNSIIYSGLIQHRASTDALTLMENILRSSHSRIVYLNFHGHDSVTADTETVRCMIRGASQYTIYD